MSDASVCIKNNLNLSWIYMMLRSYLTFCLMVLLSACHSEKPQQAMPPTNVTDYVVELKSIPAVFDFVGFAQSTHPVDIRAKVEGYLQKISYIEGSQVHTGDIMFEIDPEQFQAKVQEAKGEVDRQEALLVNAILTVNRLTPLYEQKAASKKDLDNATANKLAIEAALATAKAQLDFAIINLGYTKIIAPIDGQASKAHFREGDLVNPASNSLLTTVSAMDPIWVYFPISDNDILGALKEATQKSMTLPKETEYTVEVIFSDGSIYPYRGKVDYSSPSYDQATGTLQVRAVFPNPESNLRPGQFVRVKVYGAERPDAIVVPLRALMQKKNGMFVYLIDKDNKVVAQDVSTGPWVGDYQVITNGLKQGDRVVVDGINKIRPGMTVNITGPWNAPSTL